MTVSTRVAVLGASGLIGEAIANRLLDAGVPVVAVARRFTKAQKARFGGNAVEVPIVALGTAALAQLFAEQGAGVVVNCIGVLQDGPKGRVHAVHAEFVNRLIAAMTGRSMLLAQVSVPQHGPDPTRFSQSKHEADAAIAASGLPYVILRPGFVIGSRAYGGSALMRALAVLPFDLPKPLAAEPFSVTAIGDLAETMEHVANRWAAGERNWHETWDVVAVDVTTVGDVLSAFRKHFGGPVRRVVIPEFALRAVAFCGDAVSLLGWSPPVRSTALAEMRRGLCGTPENWMTKTEIQPASLPKALRAVPATVQEDWFARLYLLKAAMIGVLASFWIVSGLAALTVAFGSASAVLTDHGAPLALAKTITVLTGLLDIMVGFAIAFRTTCRASLRLGIVLTASYLAAATFLAPELWLAPLGPLVKAVPVAMLMIVLDAILADR